MTKTGKTPSKRAIIARGSLAYDLLVLVVQIAAIALGVVVVFSFVFGVMRVSDRSMEPRFLDGDLTIFYRLDKRYEPRDVAVFEYNGLLTSGRVVAMAGDTVNIDSQGLLVNGSYQQEEGITDETTQVADGVTFPLTVPDGAVFLLGDNRDEAVDSRIVGCVPADQTLGKVIGLFRRRGF
ncbi:MAG: signal peptidase I [Coriobacteriales bacterium]|nr:signal peptidase I [Coriobacteriales bacterium]